MPSDCDSRDLNAKCNQVERLTQGDWNDCEPHLMSDDRLARLAEIASALPQEYRGANEDWSTSTDPDGIVLGLGGSSIVVRALYRERLRRAVKIYLPRSDLRSQLDMGQFIASYENELVRQSSLSHQNVSKVTDFASVELEGVDYPILATEFIEGTSLDEFARRDDVSGEQIVDVLKDVLRGLDYLHRNLVMHCDLKPENVLVSNSPDTTGIIVDLGSSRHFPDLSAGLEDELLYLYTTTRYVNSRLTLLVSNWTQNRITRKDLRKHFPYQDLHSFGVILEDFIADDVISFKLRGALGSGYHNGLKFIIGRLKNSRATNDYFHNAAEVAESLDKVGKHSLSVLGIPELALAPEKGVLLPTKGQRMHGTGRVDRIMSHPLFQRFHHLPQLDLLHWTLPGATHTRYVHAAHSFDIARQAIGHMLNDWEVRLQITAPQIEQALFGTLLNQMGHYHFLHMFEDFIGARDTDPVVRDAQLLDDEELLDDILAPAHTTGLGSSLAEITDDRGRTLPEIVESLGLDWKEVRRNQRKPPDPLSGVLASLLSGPLDVEKLAYLRADSVATGLQFGVGLDGNAVFEALVVPSRDDWKSRGAVSGITMGVGERAMSYLEYGVLNRYWNIQTAYWNRTNRAIQAMVKFQIACLLRARIFDFEAYIHDTLHCGAHGALRWMNDRFEYGLQDGAIPPETVNPLTDILQSRRVIYRRLITISGKSAIPGRDPDFAIYGRVQALSPLSDDIVCKVIKGVLESVMPGILVRPGEILVDLPRVSRDTPTGNVLVYTDEGKTLMGDLFSISPNLQQHQDAFDRFVKRMRIYVHPRIYNEVLDAGRLQAVYDEGLAALRSKFR